MNQLESYLSLKKQVENLRREHDQADGALDQLRGQLQDKFQCKTIKEARKLLESKRVNLEVLERKSKGLMEEFESKHGGKLND